MQVRIFLFGMLVGLLLARAAGRALRLRLRDRLAAAIDAGLRRAAVRHGTASVHHTL